MNIRLAAACLVSMFLIGCTSTTGTATQEPTSTPTPSPQQPDPNVVSTPITELPPLTENDIASPSNLPKVNANQPTAAATAATTSRSTVTNPKNYDNIFTEIEPLVPKDSEKLRAAKENHMTYQMYRDLNDYLSLIDYDGNYNPNPQYEAPKIVQFCVTRAEKQRFSDRRIYYKKRGFSKNAARVKALADTKRSRSKLSYEKLRKIQREVPAAFASCWHQIMYEYPMDDGDLLPGGEQWSIAEAVLLKRDDIGRHFGIDPGHSTDTKDAEEAPKRVIDNPYVSKVR